MSIQKFSPEVRTRCKNSSHVGKNLGVKNKVHVRCTIMHKPLKFAKNCFGILFRQHVGLFRENKILDPYPPPSFQKSLFCDTRVWKFSPQVNFCVHVSVVLFTKNQVCQKTCFLKHIKKIVESYELFFQKRPNVGQNDPKMWFFTKTHIFYSLNLLASKIISLLNYLWCLEKIVFGERIFWKCIFRPKMANMG